MYVQFAGSICAVQVANASERLCRTLTPESADRRPLLDVSSLLCSEKECSAQ